MTPTQEKQAYPLDWPDGWRRTPPAMRQHSRFKTNADAARRNLLVEVGRLGGADPIISTNIRRRKDGSDGTETRWVVDPGVALYFTRKGVQQVIACDHYKDVGDNIHAIGLTIEALRAMARHGASTILDRAFKGFIALPPAGPPWHQVLGVPADADEAAVDAAARAKLKECHPDRGGSTEAFQRVQGALEQFKRERAV